ncbi:hypothetical protein DRP05_14905 [Archaeoglobales archaeon]|nr:MAG: hypothetical protein DRP05_14905 [Archaeoglobales archaeon]
MNELREKTLIELFGALDGIYGPNYECKYYPCHFENQDCSLCYCPFYPCLICDLGEIKVSSEGNYVWSCENCFWIHEKENVEDVLFVLGNYPKQRLIEEDWLFYNKILQELLFGEEIGEVFGNSYSLMPIMLNKNCEVVDTAEFLAVKIEDFCITQVRRLNSIDDADQEVLIPLKADNRMFGFVGGNYLVCYF